MLFDVFPSQLSCTFFSHRWSFARMPRNLEQVAHLLCAQVNSASYPQWDGKWVAYGLRVKA